MITDDEWDFTALKNGHGTGHTTTEKVAAQVNEVRVKNIFDLNLVVNGKIVTNRILKCRQNGQWPFYIFKNKKFYNSIHSIKYITSTFTES